MIHYKKRTWALLLGLFVAVFSFTFLTAKFKDNKEVVAADPWAFNAGNIMSDWQMSNYNSMSEADIQAFLSAKNPCDNRDYGLYSEQSRLYPGVSWHWEGDHFVCLSQERFGDGMTVGAGDTAAHIIWQAAQDYQINPQVLIVLLEKENGLITDTYPHTGQYKTATGFGCPDTAACDTQYYGFKNQIRHAAALFREVLNGGWSNYPVGANYVQYNPNPACGGTIIDIQNRATSALYRYTPYQPNWSALNAGYGIGDACGAYGNRNFFLYFEDWFGGATRAGLEYVAMDEPRYMITTQEVERVTSYGAPYDTLEQGRMIKFTSKTFLADGRACLRSEFSTEHGDDACVPMEFLENVTLEKQEVTGENTEKIIRAGATKIRIRAEEPEATFGEEMVRIMPIMTEFNGKKYYITEYDQACTDGEYGFLAEDVESAPEYQMFDGATEVTLGGGDVNRMDLRTGEYRDTLYWGSTYAFLSRAELNGQRYYRTAHNTVNNIFWGVPESELEKSMFVDFSEPRYFTVGANARRINPLTGELYDVLPEGTAVKFTTKVLLNGGWYYRTEHNSNEHEFLVVASWDLIDNYGVDWSGE